VTTLRKLWNSVRHQSTTDVGRLTPDSLPETPEQRALAGLEGKLDVWTRWAKRSERDEPDRELAAASLRAEKELRRFLGAHALKTVQSWSGESCSGNIVFMADRLFVAFLGRRAAMAITRKVSDGCPPVCAGSK
jgi:hypothetical protein